MSNKRSTYVRKHSIVKALSIGAVAGVLIAGGAVAGAAVQHSMDASAPVPTHTVTVDQTYTGEQVRAFTEWKAQQRNTAYGNMLTILPCIEEDSINCAWNAEEAGNGEGTSFINYDGHYYYAEENGH